MPEMVLQNELERLKRFDYNLKWFQLHYDELKERYRGEYVAITNEEPVDHDRDIQALINRLREKYGDISYFVIELVHEQQLAYIV